MNDPYNPLGHQLGGERREGGRERGGREGERREGGRERKREREDIKDILVAW